MQAADSVAELAQIEREFAAVITLMDRSAVFRHAAALVPQEVGLEVGFAAERIDDLDTLAICAVAGNRTDAFEGLVIPAGVGLPAPVFALPDRIAVVDFLRESGVAYDFERQWRAEGLQAAAVVPIKQGPVFYGVLCGGTREAGELSARTIEALTHLAGQTGLALQVANHAREMAAVAAHEEHRHLALPLHDSLGAILFSVGAAARDVETGQESVPALRARLNYIERQVAEALAQLNQLRSLNEVPQRVALGVALRAECQALEQRTGIAAGCVVLGDFPAVNEARAKLLLLVGREALLQTERRARARSVVVSLHAVDNGVSLIVTDDGLGTGPGEEHLSSLGLKATADCLKAVGGQVVVSTNEDGGCTMRAWIPC